MSWQMVRMRQDWLTVASVLLGLESRLHGPLLQSRDDCETLPGLNGIFSSLASPSLQIKGLIQMENSVRRLSLKAELSWNIFGAVF